MSRKIAGLWLLCALLIGGCALLPAEIMPTRSGITIPSITPDSAVAEVTPVATSIALPDGVYDALPAMQGICYESASDAVGRVFVIQSAEAHIDFYNQVDNSNLCRQPIRRYPFDFTTGDVLAGLWNAGTGCTATHTIDTFQRDDSARTINITATFSTAGNCPYQLVRGLWLGIENAQGYVVTITVE